MKTYIKPVLIILLIAIGLTSCKKYALNPVGENAIWPMAVGNSWDYNDRYQYFKDGQLVLDETEEFSLLVFEKSYEFVNDEKEESFRLEHTSKQYPRYQAFRIRFEGDQVVIADSYEPNGLTTGDNISSGTRCSYAYTQKRSRPVVTFPIAEGAQIEDRQWYWLGCSPNFIPQYQGNGVPQNSFPGTLEFKQAEVGPLDTLIQTPAGTFSCMKYGGAYWSAGTGWIKAEYTANVDFSINGIEVDSISRTRELARFLLK